MLSTTTAAAAARRDATATSLRYVNPDDAGIERRRAGRGFAYIDADGRPIRSPGELARIKATAIPPAWTDVWICPHENGHIQATGRDARGRRQYRYHPRFRARRDRGKFARLIAFGERLPRIRRRLRQDLARRGLPKEKVLATVVSLLDATPLRVGNAAYARLNRSFGISTLRGRHANVTGSTIHFRFRGKGGRSEERSLVDGRLAGVVRRCHELPGHLLFQFLDADGEPQAISSEDVNAYLREAAGTEDVSAKDFRTWSGTVRAYRALREAPAAAQRGSDHIGRRRRRNLIADALQRTAQEIGDTVAVTRNAYVHPAVLEAFEGDPGRDGPVAAPISGSPRADQPSRRLELDVLALLRRARPTGLRRRRKSTDGR